MSDPYESCETDCYHDLARGVLISELDADGPEDGHSNAVYPYWSPERNELINTAAMEGSWQNWLRTAQETAQRRTEQ